MKQPFLKDDDLLNDINAPRDQISHFALWWLGQSGFLLQWQGHHVLLDPYLSDSLTRKYQGTSKPHVRMTELVIPPERLDFIEWVTASHHHTDHLDPDTLRPLARANPPLRLLCPAAHLPLAAERSGLASSQLRGLDAGEHLSLDPFTIHAVPAAHETLDKDPAGHCLYLGYVIQFGPWTLYHSGDTVRFDGMAEWLRPFQPDVALLPINGRRPERRVAGNLWGREAAALARDIGARVVIPCHYDLFEFNTETPNEFLQAGQALGLECVVLQNGQGWRSETSLRT